MRIGFITYEFPPDIAQGGIATYTDQVTRILAYRGHDVEVFCASNTRTISEKIDNVLVHRSKCTDPQQFTFECLAKFSERHRQRAFDIIESPEIHGNAIAIKNAFPSLPLVVKVHTPVFLQMRLLRFYTPWYVKLRFFLGSLRRGKIKFFGTYNKLNDVDYHQALLADALVSPSTSLKNILSKSWDIPREKFKVIHYPFLPQPKLIAQSINSENKEEKIVLFVGKLNVHKGIVALVKAIPKIVKKHPDVIFYLLGNDSNFDAAGMKMSEFIRLKLSAFQQNIKITGPIDYSELPQYYERASVCVFPSIWENFPLVCLEAMSAGKAIVGSKEGGMSELLANGAGILVNPLNSNEIAEAISQILSVPIQQTQLGSTARNAVVTTFDWGKQITQMEGHFKKVIANVKD